MPARKHVQDAAVFPPQVCSCLASAIIGAMFHPETVPLARVFAASGLTTWLIGGQAVELLCGHLFGEGGVRPHDDIDFLVRQEDAEAAVKVMEGLGFAHVHGSLEAGDVFYRRGDLLVDLVPIDDAQDPPRTTGELAALAWPAGFLTPYFVDGVRTLTPEMHVEMKRVVAEFYGVELREKDRVDLAALSRFSTVSV